VEGNVMAGRTRKATTKRAPARKTAKRTATKSSEAKPGDASTLRRDDGDGREHEAATTMSSPARSQKEIATELEHQTEGGSDLGGESMIDDNHERVTRRD
jgi:hypothetical protein